jgi:hypothetical protein
VDLSHALKGYNIVSNPVVDSVPDKNPEDKRRKKQ